MNLEPCPFCGSGKLKIVRKSREIRVTGYPRRVHQESFSVRCNVCHARGGTASGKIVQGLYEDIPSWSAKESDIVQQAAELWNKRDEQQTSSL